MLYEQYMAPEGRGPRAVKWLQHDEALRCGTEDMSVPGGSSHRAIRGKLCMRASRGEQHAIVGHGTMYDSVECTGPLQGSGDRVRIAPLSSSRVQTAGGGCAHLVKIIISKPLLLPPWLGSTGRGGCNGAALFN